MLALKAILTLLLGLSSAPVSRVALGQISEDITAISNEVYLKPTLFSISSFTLEWVDKPQKAYIVGPEKILRSFQRNEEGGSVDISHSESRTFKVGTELKIKAPSFFPLITEELGFSVSETTGTQETLKHSFKFRPYSLASVVFKERQVMVKGKFRIIYHQNDLVCLLSVVLTMRLLGIYCKQPTFAGYVDITVSEVDGEGKIVGEYAVYYEGTGEFKHPEFDTIEGRDILGLDVDTIEDLTSPRDCGNHAIQRDVDLAVYYKTTKLCVLKGSVRGTGAKTYTKSGGYLGEYDIHISKYDREVTRDRHRRADWTKRGNCDTITDADNNFYVCKGYQHQTDSFVMFRRYKKAATQLAESRVISRTGRREIAQPKD